MITRLVLLALLLTLPAAGEVIFEDGFETLDTDRWTVDIRGEGDGASIDIVDGGVRGKCLRITSRGQYVYLTCRLDVERLRGSTLVMTGMVRLEGCEQGPQAFSTPKFHFAYRTNGAGTTVNAAERWTGTFDWTEKRLQVDVPDNATFLVMDIGNQNGTGVFYVDEFRLEDTFGSGRPINLLPACNTGRSDGVAGDGTGSFIDTGPRDLFALPEGNLDAGEVTFSLPPPGTNGGQVMIALAGRERPMLPRQSEPVPVGRRLSRLAMLHAAAFATAGEPLYTVRLHYGDGTTAEVAFRAGADAPNYDAPDDVPADRLAWRGRCAAGVEVGVGWSLADNPSPGKVVQRLVFESAGAGVPLILAASYLR